MSGGIQSSISTQPAPAIAGDFASANPRYSVDAGPNGLVAGLNGLASGLFAWLSYSTIDGDGAPAAANNSGTGPVAGIVPRNQQGLITTYLTSAGVTIPAGFQATVISAGDMWIKNDGATEALPNQKAYASFANGKANFAATASPNGATSSAGSIAASTNSFVGSISNDVLTVTGSVVGTIYPGTTLSGTGVASGTKILAQLSGIPGGIGTYAVNIPEQVVASTAISGTYGTFTVGGSVVGTFAVGDTLTGSGISAVTTITALGSGSGGAGTYIVDVNTVVNSTVITAATNVETSWYARSAGLPGELVKVSNVPGLG